MAQRTDPGESADGILGAARRPIDSVSVPAVVVDGAGVVRATNQAWRLFGELNDADPVATGPGADYLAAAGGAEDSELVEGLRAVLAGRRVFFEREYLCPSPTEDRWFLMRAVSIPVDDAMGALVVHLDRTAEHLAAAGDDGPSADPVTGLVDRATAAAIVEERIAQGEVVPAGLAVTTIHLRGLDDVVRALGDKAGEKVLVQVVARANRLVRRGDVLCRSGPATLTLVRPSAGDEDARASLVDRLAAAFDHPFQVGVHQVVLAVEVRSGGRAVTVGATRVLSPAEWDLHGPASPHGRAALDEVVRARTALLDAVGEAVLALDDRACVVHMNTAAEQLFGWSNEDARGRHLRELGSSDLTSDQVEAVVRHVWAGGTWADDLVIRLRSGRRFEAQVSAAPLLVEGQVSAVITSTVDVSRRLAAVADLSHQVRHDRLTGLRNRAALIESLDEVLTDVASADGATSATVIVVDLEDFRSQNRVLGPALGDHLLRATAAALRQTTHPGDVLARVSGDSFAVCCSHLRDDEAAVRYADHLREAVARPVILGGVRVVLRSSAGVALVRPPTPSSSELLRRADAALLDAKAVGRSSLAYHHQMDERLRRQALLEVLIRRMVAGGRAPLAYQAIHRLADGAVIGAEALLRLRGDSGVPVSPQEVFAAADRAGLSRDVGRLVLEAACQEARRWADRGPSVSSA
ncbi:MAG: diguanylate cyclase [Acidimicrobiales bacterium]